MANVPYKKKNVLGMAQPGMSNGAQGGGGGMFQGGVPGTKQIPYWQTSELKATPTKPLVTQPISQEPAPVDDPYALDPSEYTGDVDGGSAGTVWQEGDTRVHDGVKQVYMNGQWITDIGDAGQGPLDSDQPSAGDTGGMYDPGSASGYKESGETAYQFGSSGQGKVPTVEVEDTGYNYIKDMLDNGSPSTDWAKQNAALGAEFDEEAAKRMDLLAQQMAARGMSASGLYTQGVNALTADIAQEKGAALVDLQKQQAAEELGWAQVKGQLASVLSDADIKKAIFAYEQASDAADRAFALGSLVTVIDDANMNPSDWPELWAAIDKMLGAITAQISGGE